MLSKRTGGGSINDGQSPQPGILKNYALIFNVGKPPFPAFASVEKVVKENQKIMMNYEIKESPEVEMMEVHGLVYRLNIQQFMAMLVSEGFPLAYQIEPVLVDLYSGNSDSSSSSSSSSSSRRRRRVKAYTLRSNGGGLVSYPPSKRYKDLLIKGSETNGLDSNWIQRLNQIETNNGIW